jgi:hypothetical protein
MGSQRSPWTSLVLRDVHRLLPMRHPSQSYSTCSILGNPLTQALTRHLPEGLEVEVPQACMPPPCLPISVNQETNQLWNVNVEHEEPVQGAWNPGEQTSLSIPDTH